MLNFSYTIFVLCTITFGPSQAIKYILQWTAPGRSKSLDLGKGRVAFVRENCTYTNCFITTNKNLFVNLSNFDAIMFDTKDIQEMSQDDFPTVRSPRQKYILTASEPADRLPICKPYLDHFFNWTWTYKLDSDIVAYYFKIYDKKDVLVGPRKNVEWRSTPKKLRNKLRKKLLNKSEAVAWYVDECEAFNRREIVALNLLETLKTYGWNVDIFGNCTKKSCPPYDPCCHRLLRKYHFYLAFESSTAEDYVTDTVLTALNNYVVPIVYGGANYSRFLPPGSYLNAKELDATVLAQKIAKILEYTNLYTDLFRWRHHYIYKKTDSPPGICELCAKINDEKQYKAFSSYCDIRSWYNGDSGICKGSSEYGPKGESEITQINFIKNFTTEEQSPQTVTVN